MRTLAEPALILIPDISGFTEFTSSTELDHAAHIITELLELIVEANETDLTLAEIEGDAVLFYRTGEPLRRGQLVHQCLEMFSRFHRQLMVIERDAVCQCGACQTASNLTLKFIAHYGQIKEIRVARFVKATGVDMIVAHRLLKNDLDSHEYILMSEPCCEVVGQEDSHPELRWSKSTQAYPSIGRVRYEFAELSGFRAGIPRPPARARYVVERGEDSLEVTIEAPLLTVHQTLIDVDKRPDWLAGVDSVDRDMTSERIGMRHNCAFMGLSLINTTVHHEFRGDRAIYSERVEFPRLGATMAHYDMEALSNGTRLTFNVNWLDTVVPPAQKQEMLAAAAENLELLKGLCERR